MGTKTIALGVIVDGNTLAAKIRDSQYMKSEGYSVHYDVEITAKEAAKEDRKFKQFPPDEVVVFGVCLAKDDLGYVHFRVRAGQVSEFYYFAFMANKNKLAADLAELVKEVKVH